MHLTSSVRLGEEPDLRTGENMPPPAVENGARHFPADLPLIIGQMAAHAILAGVMAAFCALLVGSASRMSCLHANISRVTVDEAKAPTHIHRMR